MGGRYLLLNPGRLFVATMALCFSYTVFGADSEPHMKTKVCGNNEAYCADVSLSSGIRRLHTDSIVQIEQLLGQILYSHSWVIVVRGATGNTITVNIPDESISIVTTQNVADTTDDLLAARVVNTLNANGTFSAKFKATRPIGMSLVLVEAKEPDLTYPDINDFNVSSTGSITYTVGYDNIIRRGIPLAVFPHPKDPRVGTINIGGGSIVPTLGTNLVYEDMNVSTGGIARGTTVTAGSPGAWVRVYTYSGSGLLLGFLQTVEDAGGTGTNYWQVRMTIDGVEIFGSNGISLRDMSNGNLYNFNTGTTPSPIWAGLNLVQNTIAWQAPNNLPLTFSTNVTIYVRRWTSVNRVWRAGLVAIVKET